MATGGELAHPAWVVDWVAETDSTNADLLERARAGAPAGSVLVAGYQRAGRGRRGRTWTAAPGSALLASVLLRPPLDPAAAARVTMAAALAASDACRHAAGVEVGLKWPNDLVVDSGTGRPAKLAGLLAESLVAGRRLEAVVVGMGLNLSPGSATVAGAACLEELAGQPVEASNLLAAWLDRLGQRLPSLGAPGDELVDDYRRRCHTLGRRVRVELAGESFEGDALDVDRDGRLLVATATGRRLLAAGDVVHLGT